MIDILIKNRALINKINFYLALLLAFWMPLYKDFLPYIIWLWGISWILEGNFKKKFSNLNNKNVLLLLLLFYIFHVISLAYSNNFKVGLFDIQVKFSIFLFPILLAGSNYLYKKNYKKIFFSFVFGNIVASLICLIVAFYHSISFVNHSIIFDSSIGWSSYFVYSHLAIFQHPSYFAMYLVFATAILFYLFDYENKFNKIKYKLFYLSTVILFFIMIFLLSSRAGIISEFVVLIGSFFIYIFKYKKLINSLVYFIFICISFLFVFNNNFRMKSLEKNISQTSKVSIYDSLKNKIQSSTKATILGNDDLVNKNEKSSKVETKNHNNIRIRIWNETYKLIKKNFFIGTGAGDIKSALSGIYKTDNNTEAKEKHLNVHNQFLETFIGQGIIGVLMLIFILVIPLYRGLKNRNYLPIFFVLIVSLNFVFESMLNTISGVVFFAFFYSMLVFIKYNKKTIPQ